MLLSSRCFLAWISQKMGNTCLTKLPLNPLMGSFYLAEPGSEHTGQRLVSRKYCTVVFSLAARQQTANFIDVHVSKQAVPRGWMQPAGSREGRGTGDGSGMRFCNLQLPHMYF